MWRLLLRTHGAHGAYGLVRGVRGPYYRALQGLVYYCRVYTILAPSRQLGICRFLLSCSWLPSSDGCVSSLRARSLAEAVSAGTVAIVEEPVISPPADSTLSTSAAAEESAVLGLAALESVSFFLGKIVTGVETAWFD